MQTGSWDPGPWRFCFRCGSKPMSYIHEALKKAQKKRDGRLASHGGGSPSRGMAGFGPGKWALWCLSGGMVVLLAFTAYSWLDLPGNFKERESLGPPPKPLAPVQVFKQGSQAKDFFERGRVHQKNGRWAEARQWYEKALQADPGFVVALNNLGVIQMQDHHYDSAARNFQKAVRLKPGYVDPYYNLACISALTNRTQEALRYLKKAVFLDSAVREWACEDSDLRGLQHLMEFQQIVGTKP